MDGVIDFLSCVLQTLHTQLNADRPPTFAEHTQGLFTFFCECELQVPSMVAVANLSASLLP